MNVRPAKTRINLGIRPVWSESSLSAQWVAKDPSFLHAASEDWSDRADAQTDLSLRWAHSHLVGFVMSRLISSMREFRESDSVRTHVLSCERIILPGFNGFFTL